MGRKQTINGRNGNTIAQCTVLSMKACIWTWVTGCEVDRCYVRGDGDITSGLTPLTLTPTQPRETHSTNKGPESSSLLTSWLRLTHS